MSFTEKILEKSNSYNYYKNGYEKGKKKKKELKDEINKKNKEINKKNKEINKKNKEIEIKNNEIKQLKKLNSELINKIEKSINLLNDDFNNYKSIDYNNQLHSKEVRYAIVFKDTINNCEWIKNTTFELNNGAANYSFMYTLFRILNEIQPQNILELGLGQTTKLTTQYVNFYKNSKITIIDHDNVWIENFSKKLSLEGNITISCQDTEKFTYNNTENLRYKDLSKIVKDNKFDLIIIDGPNGFFPENGQFLTYSRSNIWSLIENNLNDDFIIIMDDYERQGEKNTMHIVMQLLKEKNITYYTFKSIGLKEQFVICSEKYKYVKWF